MASGNASSAAPAEPVGNTFCFVVRNFRGYFYFSRWPGRLEPRRKLAAIIGLRPGMSMIGAGIRFLSRPTLPMSATTWLMRPVVAFVASVPGKNRRSLAFSRWPGRLETRCLAAALIGPALMVLTVSMV